MLQRARPQRAEEGVVDGDGAVGEHCIPGIAHRLDIDQRVSGVGGAFKVDHCHLAAAFCGLRLGFRKHGIQFLAGRASGEIDIADPEAAQHLGDKPFGGGIERPGMDDHIVLAGIGHHQDADRGHAARKGQRVLGSVPHRETIFEDFLIRAVEARIHKAFRSPFAQAGDAFEVALAGRRAFEGEGAGEEDRCLQRSFGQHGIIAVAHHQGRRLQRTARDFALGGLGLAAGGGGFDSVDGVRHGPCPSLCSRSQEGGSQSAAGRAPVPNLRRNASPLPPLCW